MVLDLPHVPEPLLADPRLPASDPFTYQQAVDRGVSRHVLSRLSREGSVRRVLRGVFVDATVPDTLEVRARALSLAVPESAVVTDRTAAWLRGVPALAPGDHLVLPQVSVVRPRGETRVRHAAVRGGIRGLRPDDVEVLNGVRVTTALRTALDLGRLVRRDQAIGALDALLRTGEFSRSQLLGSLGRFKGYRGVRQLRELAPLADPRAESPGESVLRLRWLDVGLPTPDLQIALQDVRGRLRYRGDLGLARFRYLAEYDGEDFHSSAAQRAHDQRRRDWLRTRGWVVVVIRGEDIYGPAPRVHVLLREGWARARYRLPRTG